MKVPKKDPKDISPHETGSVLAIFDDTLDTFPEPLELNGKGWKRGGKLK